MIRILIPTDDSPHALRAVQHVIDMAKAGLKVELHLLNVQLPVHGSTAAFVGKAELSDYHREEGTKAIASAQKLAEAGGLKPQLHISVGEAGATIVGFADQLGCAQIVMGTRGFGSAAGLLLGSAAQHVVSHTKLPVTLLRAS
jgi:nucleotide-binding universal stress UspA family protein